MARDSHRGVGASLRHRSYRLFFFGQLVSVIGTWMQTIAQSFLVLTHSGTQLGLTTAARFLPILVFGQAACSRRGLSAELPAELSVDLSGAGQPVADRLDEASDANTTTELR